MEQILTLQDYLSSKKVSFSAIAHKVSHSPIQTSAYANIPCEQLAKCVLLKNKLNQYVMGILPADRQLLVSAVNDFKYNEFTLLSEDEVFALLAAGKQNVEPNLVANSPVQLVIDPEILLGDAVYLEAGDHVTVLKVMREDFEYLVQDALCASLGGPLIAVSNRPSPSVHTLNAGFAF